MIKWFCDRCGRELSGRENKASNRVTAHDGFIKVEVHVARDGTWNTGEVCHRCVVEIVLKSLPVPAGHEKWVEDFCECGDPQCDSFGGRKRFHQTGFENQCARSWPEGVALESAEGVCMRRRDHVGPHQLITGHSWRADDDAGKGTL